MTGARPRRHNAPVNPRRESTVLPDVLLALGSAGWVMGASLLLASFADTSFTTSDAGRQLARLFAATLGLAGTFVGLVGAGLLRTRRGNVGQYVAPIGIGAAIGALEATLVLAAAGALLLAPLALIVLASRPLRRWVGRLLPRRPRSGR